MLEDLASALLAVRGMREKQMGLKFPDSDSGSQPDLSLHFKSSVFQPTTATFSPQKAFLSTIKNKISGNPQNQNDLKLGR